MAKDHSEHWIRVPRTKRSKSISGVEELIGKASRNKRETSPVDLEGGTVTEGMEIESLIIPEIAVLHAERMAEHQQQNGVA